MLCEGMLQGPVRLPIVEGRRYSLMLCQPAGLLLESRVSRGLTMSHVHRWPPHPYAEQALVPLKRAVDEGVIPAVAKANIRERIAALTRRYLDAQKVGVQDGSV